MAGGEVLTFFAKELVKRLFLSRDQNRATCEELENWHLIHYKVNPVILKHFFALRLLFKDFLEHTAWGCTQLPFDSQFPIA